MRQPCSSCSADALQHTTLVRKDDDGVTHMRPVYFCSNECLEKLWDAFSAKEQRPSLREFGVGGWQMVLVAVLVGFLSLPALAQEMSVGIGVACDTQAQMESFMTRWDGKNGPEVMKAVNDTEGKDNACLATTWAFVENKTVNPRLQTSTGAWRIVEVSVVGVFIGTAMMQFPSPMTQFIALKLVEREA